MAGVVSRCDASREVRKTPDWRAVLAGAVRDLAELCRLLQLDQSDPAVAELAAADFPVLVPQPLLGRIQPANPRDPLLLQVLPQGAELASAPGFAADPLEEATALIGPGLLQKYRGRSLMVPTGACGVHCRYCFRRHVSHQPSPHALQDIDPVLRRISSDESIHELILSGGDPLIIRDSQLSQFARRLAAIPHLHRLRIHTRLPVVIPQRVNDELLGWLRGTRLSTIMVVQINHPNEIDDAVAAALGRLVEAGVPVLNQSVLLRGVNDSPDVLAALCERLIDLRAMPYYLHQLDRVAGAAHFEVPEATGIRLIEQLRARLPGYAVPRYVRETPGAPGKVVLA